MNVQNVSKIINKIKDCSITEQELRDFFETDYKNNSVPCDQWNKDWIKSVYELGNVFSDKDAGLILRVIEDVKSRSSEKEVFDFIYSEIIWNFFEQNNEYIKNTFKEFLLKYPTNPEFHHSYSHYLENNKNYDQALFEAKTACRLDGDNILFQYNYLHKIKTYFNFLLEKGSLEKARTLLKEGKEFLDSVIKPGLGRWEFFSSLSSMEDRLHDYEAIDKKVKFFEKEIQNTIKIEQRVLIEILGIFSAIIAFILTNITIFVSSLTPREAMYLMIGLAIVLLIFVMSLSFLFGSRYRSANWKWYLGHPKLLVIVLLSVALFLMYFFPPFK